MYQQQFHSIIISEKCMHSINSNPHRDEAYTTLNVRPPNVPSHGHTLRLKIDQGTGNTLPLGTFRQMYASAYKRLKKNNMKLSAYSGHEIPFYGTIHIPCQYKDFRWPTKGRHTPHHKARVDVVDCEEPEEEYMYQQQFHSIIISEKCMHSINSNPHRDEAYTTLNVRPPNVPSHGHTLRLKIDQGTGNTLPLGTFRQMYASAYKRLKKNNMKLSAYSGHEIPFYGTIHIPCQYKDFRWVSANFYVVDVPGPAVVGLPTSE
ncbi:hypothetical protein GBF38_016632, partial [Nibea albiflora]